MRRLFLFLLILLLSVGVSSCGRQEGNRTYFSYLDAPAKAALTGRINSLSFAARLTLTGRGEGGVVDATLVFDAPESLRGVAITARGGEWSTSLGVLTGENSAEGLGRIASLFCVERAVRSSASSGDTITLTLSDGATLVLDRQSGQPLSASLSDGGRAIEITIAEWQSGS
jgi:hypothetical protein